MAYTFEKMRKLTTEEIGERFLEDGLIGYFLLYPDNTEAVIDTAMNLDEIIDAMDNGVEFGEELNYDKSRNCEKVKEN